MESRQKREEIQGPSSETLPALRGQGDKEELAKKSEKDQPTRWEDHQGLCVLGAGEEMTKEEEQSAVRMRRDLTPG